MENIDRDGLLIESVCFAVPVMKNMKIPLSVLAVKLFL